MVSISQGQMKSYSYGGVAYRRVGNTNLTMSRDEYNQMLFERMHSEQRWKNQPATGWPVDDRDIAEIHRTVDEAIRRARYVRHWRMHYVIGITQSAMAQWPWRYTTTVLR